jgi:hypothetical protein
MKSRYFLLVFLLFVFISGHISGIQLRKEFELEFETALQFFVFNGNIHLWQGGFLHIYSGSILTRKVPLMNKGEGPGDFRIIQNAISDSGKYYFWDRMLRRLSIFSDGWELLSMRKLNFPSVTSALVGIRNNHLVFMWNTFENRGNKRVRVEHIGYMKGDHRKSLAHLPGVWVRGKTINHDIPHLLYGISDQMVYYANNQKYKIYSINLKSDEPKSSLFIERDVKYLKWREEFSQNQWEILKKPNSSPDENFPEYVPPLFDIIADRDLLVVVSNQNIDKRQSKIDIFKRGQYIGSTVIPLLYQQNWVFPFVIRFPADIYLSEASLFSFHYMGDLDVYKIIKWKIII